MSQTAPDPSGSIDYWKNQWEEGDIGFHLNEPNQILVDNIDHLVAGRQAIKILVPLCGKSKDMIWLAELGHSVVGIECSDLAVTAFFKENNIEHTKHTVSAIAGAVLYKSENDLLHVYVCDLYAFNVDMEGTFQGIWDRGSLTAIAKEDSVKYSKLMRSLMAPDCCYLLALLEFDDSTYKDCPHSNSHKDILDLFSVHGSVTITFLWHNSRKAPRPQMLDAGIVQVCDMVYLLTYQD